MSGPNYISWLGHGAASLAAPGVFTDAKAHMFGFEADQAAMQATVDALLNPATCGKLSYEVALPLGMVSFMDIAQCTSATDVVGWLPGRECALWIPLIEKHADPFHDRFVFWSPYIFISYTIGMLTGREIWGWPKVLGDISVATDNPADPVYGCKTTFFPTLAPTTQGVTDTLFEIKPTAANGRAAPVWQTAEDAIAGLIGTFLGGLAEKLAKALEIVPEIPSVALKQFRQPGAPGAACYQAIVNSPIEATAFYGGGPLFDSFSMQVTTCASHQIVRDFFGRAPDPGSTTIPIKFAAWLAMDFQALSGSNVVVAPGA